MDGLSYPRLGLFRADSLFGPVYLGVARAEAARTTAYLQLWRIS